MTEVNYKDQIKYFRAKVLLLIGLSLGLVIGEGLMVWQWYMKNGKLVETKKGFDLKRDEFSRLWQQLEEETVGVELRGEIKYGEGIGKLEPFE